MSVIADNLASLPLEEPPYDDADTQPVDAEQMIQVRVTLEALVYIALAVLALVVRLGALDRVPLDDVQARQALAALRTANDQIPGDAPLADSPLTFVLNTVTFGFVPGSEIAARLPVALAGVLLVLAPALWRRYLNPLPPLIISLLLAISPVAILSARTMNPVTWTMVLALVGPWLVLRFVETRDSRWALAATVTFTGMVFLAEPAGFLTGLGLGFGLVFAWLTEDDPESRVVAGLRDLVRAWPWANGVIVAGLVIAIASTGLFWIPSGLTVVGNVVWAGVNGFVERPAGMPAAFPLWIALRYETGLLIFGLIAAYRAVREGAFFERVLVGWVLAGTVWSIGYAGAGAGHAMWITVPLAVLVGLAVTNWLTEHAGVLWAVPHWGVPLHALVTMGLWLAVGLSVVLLGKRLLLDLPAGVDDLSSLADRLLSGIYSRNTNFEYQQVDSVEVQDGIFVYAYVLGFIQLRLLITVLVTLLNGVLFFLVGSLWGARASWRGFALGTLGALVLFSFSLGGRAAFDRPGDPRELWYSDPVTGDLYELRDTLREMSLRDTGDPYLIAISAQVPDDGAVAWALHRFPNTVFVNGVGPEIATAAVVAPLQDPQPAMGADYVGKDLMTRQSWGRATLSWRDAIMWFYRNESLVKPSAGERLMLWVRSDVYGVERVTED